MLMLCSENRPYVVGCLVNDDTIDYLRQVIARYSGVHIRVIAGEGSSYTTLQGIKANVPYNHVYVIVTSYDDDIGLGRLLREAVALRNSIDILAKQNSLALGE